MLLTVDKEHTIAKLETARRECARGSALLAQPPIVRTQPAALVQVGPVEALRALRPAHLHARAQSRGRRAFVSASKVRPLGGEESREQWRGATACGRGGQIDV